MAAIISEGVAGIYEMAKCQAWRKAWPWRHVWRGEDVGENCDVRLSEKIAWKYIIKDEKQLSSGRVDQ